MGIFDRLNRLSHRVWHSKDGRITPLRELHYAHLVNIISMLERKYPGVEDAHLSEWCFFGQEPQGEMAQDAFANEAFSDQVSFRILAVSTTYQALIKEKERRDYDEYEPVVHRAKEWSADRLAKAEAHLRVGGHDLVRRAPVRIELAARQLAARALAFGRDLVTRRGQGPAEAHHHDGEGDLE